MVDHNVVACFYPVESASTRQLLAAVPVAAGGELPLRHVPVDEARHRLPLGSFVMNCLGA
uniref:Uncharacterized protein n=1 Tax=Arundo donax TaxID=35708 RepID=A0A0A9DIY8_ARUDO